MSLFKKGDPVWCAIFGHGVVAVSSVAKAEEYPTMVVFPGGVKQRYTVDGKFYSDENRTLFFEEVIPHKEALERPHEKYSPVEGESIAVSNDCEVWLINSFTGMNSGRYSVQNSCGGTILFNFARPLSSFND